MADAVRAQKLIDGPKNVVYVLTNVSDGTGESAVLKVDVSALSGAPAGVDIEKIWFSTSGLSVLLYWDATTDDLAWTIPANITDTLDFCDMGGLQNPKSTGWTGDIKLTTVEHTSGDTYSIVLYMTKKW
jgi:hypothetical protein